MPDRPERRDRAVEQHEARRELQPHAVDQRERLADDLDRVDLGEPRAVVAVVDVPQLGDELRLLARVGYRTPSAPSRAGSASMFSFTASMKSAVSFERSSSESFPAMPKSTRPIVPDLVQHHDVRRVRVGVEEPVAEDHRHPRLRDQVRRAGAAPRSCTRRRRRRGAGPLEELEREDARPRVAPVDPRDAHVRMAGEVAVELLGVPRLHAGSRAPGGSCARTRPRGDRVDEVERLHPVAHEARDLVHELEVGLDLARRVRPLHLDGDALPFGRTARCTWPIEAAAIGFSLELEEQLLDGQAQLLLDDARAPPRTGTA